MVWQGELPSRSFLRKSRCVSFFFMMDYRFPSLNRAIAPRRSLQSRLFTPAFKIRFTCPDSHSTEKETQRCWHREIVNTIRDFHRQGEVACDLHLDSSRQMLLFQLGRARLFCRTDAIAPRSARECPEMKPSTPAACARF